jgi:hypothetical protein
MGFKNPSFLTDFKNVNLIFVKIASKKSYSQKTVLPIEKLAKSQKEIFWLHFYKGKMYISEISIKRRIFGYPIRPSQRKKFVSHRRVSL